MGYYTRHSLRVFGFNAETQSATLQVEDWLPEYESIVKAIADRSGYDYPFGEEIKWYDHEKDMVFVSKKFPNLLFELSGEGEESGDLWREYYQNGDLERIRAKVVFDKPTYGGIPDA